MEMGKEKKAEGDRHGSKGILARIYNIFNEEGF